MKHLLALLAAAATFAAGLVVFTIYKAQIVDTGVLPPVAGVIGMLLIGAVVIWSTAWVHWMVSPTSYTKRQDPPQS